MESCFASALPSIPHPILKRRASASHQPGLTKTQPVSLSACPSTCLEVVRLVHQQLNLLPSVQDLLPRTRTRGSGHRDIRGQRKEESVSGCESTGVRGARNDGALEVQRRSRWSAAALALHPSASSLLRPALPRSSLPISPGPNLAPT